MSWLFPCFDTRRGVSPVQLAALMLLNKKPMHGYEIAEELAKRFKGSWQINFGTIYHALSRLAEKKLVKSKEAPSKAGPKRTIYEITPKGRKTLEEAGKFCSKILRLWKECCG